MLSLNLGAGIGPISRAVLYALRLVSPRAPIDIVSVFMYRREVFGEPFCALAQAAMRKFELAAG